MAEAGRASRQVRRAQERHKSPGASTTFRVERFAVPLLLLAGFVAYQNALQGPFVLDDFRAIERNPTIRSLGPPWDVFSPPGGAAAVSARPLVNLSLALNYAWDGLNVPSYHAFNIAVHLLVALVLFGVIRRTLRSPVLAPSYGDHAGGIATAAALLWVVHPLATEAVNYTSQRTESMMALFFLLTLYCSIRTFEAPDGWRWPIAAVGAFALGAGSKEVIVVAPAVVLVSDWLFWSPSLKVALRRHYRLYAGLAAALVLYLYFIERRIRGGFSGPNQNALTPWEHARTSTGAIVHYLRLALWPNALSADYDGWPVASSIRSVLPAFLFVVALGGLTLFGLVRRSKLSFLGVWFFFILAPTSSFKPMSREIVAERRMYLPLVAVVVLVVLGGRALLRRLDAPRWARAAAVAVVALALTVATIHRNEVYRTTLSFWTDVVEKRPDNPRAQIWLGDYYAANGQKEEAARHRTEAVRLLRRDPEDGNNRYLLAMQLASLGKTEEAAHHYREAFRINPGNASAHNNLGILLYGRGEIDEAIRQYTEALRIEPDHANAHYNLAVALGKRNRTAEQIEHLEAAIRLNPDNSQARSDLAKLRSGSSQ